MNEHCMDCGSRLCGHGVCPQCDIPCKHCGGGDRDDKYFGEQDTSDPFGSFHLEGDKDEI